MKFNGTNFKLQRFGENYDLKNDTMYFTDNMSNVIDQF